MSESDKRDIRNIFLMLLIVEIAIGVGFSLLK